MIFLFLTLFAIAHLCLNKAATVCDGGRYLHTPGSGPPICEDCPTGTYMPDDNHANTSCFNCTRAQNKTTEKLVSECNKTHNSVYLCISGYFRMKLTNQQGQGECKRCKDCSLKNEKRPCLQDSDTICCPDGNHILEIDNGNLVCLQLCGPGHYTDVSTDQCMTCPEGKYMPDSQHRQEYCYICQNCLGTNPNGPYVGRPCNQTHDTVCCPQPDMEVVDDAGSAECRLPTTVPVTPPTILPDTTPEADNSSSSLSTAEVITAITVPTIVIGVIIALIVVFFKRKKRRGRTPVNQNDTQPDGEDGDL